MVADEPPAEQRKDGQAGRSEEGKERRREGQQQAGEESKPLKGKAKDPSAAGLFVVQGLRHGEASVVKSETRVNVS